MKDTKKEMTTNWGNLKKWHYVPKNMTYQKPFTYDIETTVKSALLIFVSAAISTNVYWQNMMGLHTKSQFQNIILDSNQPILFYKRLLLLFYCPRDIPTKFLYM
jgi:hypothetical protein